MASWNANNNSQYRTTLNVVQTSQNINNNTTVVNASLTITKLSGSGYWSSDNSNWSINIDGQARTGTFTYDFRGKTSITLFSGNFTITHNQDGSKSINCSSSTDLDNIGKASTSGTMTLVTIPRASTTTIPANIYYRYKF